MAGETIKSPDAEPPEDLLNRARWEMPPRQPRFQGESVFLTNGNINPFSLAGGFRVSYTGMRVINHDDSQHHVRDVQPPIPMTPTIAGLQTGHDEVVEKKPSS